MNDTVMFSSASNEWATPQDFFDRLNALFCFTLDPCSTHNNATCRYHFTVQEDGLTQDWGIHRVFMNPPYGREINSWVRKAYKSAELGALVVGLLPARTDTAWWQDYVQPYADVRFLRGRLKFGNAPNPAPFPSALAISWTLKRQEGPHTRQIASTET